MAIHFQPGQIGQVSAPDTILNRITSADSIVVDAVEEMDTVAVDSARLAQKAIQAELSREVDCLVAFKTRFRTIHMDPRIGQFVRLARAGRQQKQVFWNNPKASAIPRTFGRW